MGISPKKVWPAAPLGLGQRGLLPNLFDVIVFVIIAAAFVVLAHGAREMNEPLARLEIAPVTLDPANLPEYALRTTLRMFAAILASLVFTFVVGTLAAKSRKAELVIVPALDILQSVPVLGFLTFTVVFFMRLFPGSQLGAECAAIFAIFTAQAWNMAFSFYQSLRTVPSDLDEVSRHFRLSAWLRFWRLEVPFAAPGLIWNTMMSMSGGWFFVVASEAITVGDTSVRLPGIGAWLSMAIDERDIAAVGLAVAVMAAVILAYDQLLFRPIVAWADKFRSEQTAAQQRPRSWVFDLVRRGRVVKKLFAHIAVSAVRLPVIPLPASTSKWTRWWHGRAGDTVWLVIVLAVTGFALWLVVDYLRANLGMNDVVGAFGLGFLTLARVVILIALASLIWVPVGVWIGLRPSVAERAQPIAQFLAAFPANVLFPVVVLVIVSLRLNPNIWLSPLMILGTQWYILFNVIAGASAFPTDLREAASLFRLHSWQWWRKAILPGIFPYYLTGALTASGGSWNASIVAEIASWGDTRLEAAGLGAFVAKATDAGDYPRVVLGIAVMSIFVVSINRLLWRPLYQLAERRFRLD
ncbi:MAG TPA: ABC transporter permease subunit [Xanthobacteraceae bacterium]|nr:ABC transporter permease subunit [Xanthobacteraceae bacterium]